MKNYLFPKIKMINFSPSPIFGRDNCRLPCALEQKKLNHLPICIYRKPKETQITIIWIIYTAYRRTSTPNNTHFFNSNLEELYIVRICTSLLVASNGKRDLNALPAKIASLGGSAGEAATSRFTERKLAGFLMLCY